MRALLIVLVAAVSDPAFAAPDKKPPADTKNDKPKDKKETPANEKPPRTPGPQDAKAVAILEKLAAATTPAARDAAITELHAIAPQAMDAIGEWVARPHATDAAARKKVLAEIKAQVPDKNGKWPTPPRQSGKELIADDNMDWLKLLTALDGSLPGTAEVIADVAAIRAIASTKTMHAADVIMDIAFAEESMIYRDECGRNIRKLEPLSIP